MDRLAEILNQTDEISSELILNELEEADMEMASQIKQRMFVFEDLLLVDDRGVQKLLRKVETMELAIALKAASEEVREKIFKNMSERAGEMLKEEMASNHVRHDALEILNRTDPLAPAPKPPMELPA